METKTKSIGKKKKAIVSGKFFSTKVSVNKTDVTITLPANVIDYLGMNGNELYWAPINGVIQLCGSEPHMSIPIMNVGADKFLPQKS